MSNPQGQADRELENIAGTARAATVRWALRALEGTTVTAEELAAALNIDGPFGDPARFAMYLAVCSARLGPFHLTEVQRGTEAVVEILLIDVRARRWRLGCGVELVPPYRITQFVLERELPAGLRVRSATRADADAVADIERGSAIVRDDGTRITIVRGARLFDQLCLMDGSRVFLAEADGAPVACEAVGVQHAQVGGQALTLLYRHHTRVLPSHQRLGLNDAFSARINEFAQTEAQPDDGYVYTGPRNELVREWQASPSGVQTWRSAPPWHYRPFRALLSCAALAGPATGQPATHRDAPRVIALLNSCHAHEEMFLPYNDDRLTRRLERLPDQYGWSQLWLDEKAVVGVWESGECCRRDEHDRVTSSVRAYVLDFGFEPGGLAGFDRLLRAWCRRLAERGVTHLSIFSSPASPGSELIRDLAESVVEVQFQSRLAEPADVSQRGFYVDHVYF